jgi:hypothetical protein
MQQITVKPNGRIILYRPNNPFKQYVTIGKILGRIYYTTRNSEKNQKYNHQNSIGFSYELINDCRDAYDLICVKYDGVPLWSTSRAIVHYGTFTNYATQELQIHLHLSNFKRTKEEALAELKKLNDSDTKKNVIKTKKETELSLFS